ncbi:UDP-N-acetylmuramoyl-tripeptide--D-alanyl-D-alanine ligase-like [Planococcus citri]|uniref:UDP-MurNAc-pentapeptide synthetase n=1 Tax=Planococcus citri TaxID=170843 RepID=S5NZS3_9HEMI|nr:D-alanyl-D-alanine-adding enzyme [Planococcus citri]
MSSQFHFVVCISLVAAPIHGFVKSLENDYQKTKENNPSKVEALHSPATFQWNEKHAEIATNGTKTGNWSSTRISIDSKNIKKGDLFVALKGRHFDGHDFLNEAFAKGAVAAIVSEPKNTNYPLVIVEDTLQALQHMASFCIKHILLDTKIIAVTGSVGKTTTKDMLHSTLSQFGVSHTNRGNFNNHIGLPLTILSAPRNCQYLVLEMGMSEKGEIQRLSDISKPDIAVITNIEHAHSANFHSLFDIARAKLEILYGIKPNGTIILNKDNQYYDYLSSQSYKSGFNVMSFGKHQNTCTIQLLNTTRNGTGLNFKVKLPNNKITNLYLKVFGEHFVYSALATIAVLEALKLELPQNVFEAFKIPNGRGNMHSIQYGDEHILLIDDSYNANPASMKAAIKSLDMHSDGRKVAILGDMLELGNERVKFHTELYDCVTKTNVDKVHTVGELMLELHNLLPEAKKGSHFNSSHQVVSNLSDIIQNNDIILVKGSRGMKMELIVKAILSV